MCPIWTKPLMLFTAITMLLSACGSNEEVAAPEIKPSVSNEPVTLRLMPWSVNLADNEFKQLMADPVKKKFPNITLELMKQNPDMTPEKYVASGDFADIVFTGVGLRAFTAVNLAVDMNPYLKKNNDNLNKFVPQAIASIKEFAPNGEMFALPFSINFSVLFYNKAIFDKFSAAYPKDGMTWDEAIALGQKLTRTESGVQYLGLNAQTIHHMASQRSLVYENPQTKKVEFLTDGWKSVFQIYAKVAELSTNLGGQTGLNNLFLKDRVLAMFGDYGAKVGQLQELADQGNPLDWDMAAMPVYPDAPGQAFGFVAQSFVLSSLGKHKDEAFQVIDYLTSKEHQLKIVKSGRQSSLQGAEFEQGFGSELSVMKGKNIQAIFKNKAPANPQPSEYSDNLNNQAKAEVTAVANLVAKGQKDVNTSLSELEEKVTKIYANTK